MAVVPHGPAKVAAEQGGECLGLGLGLGLGQGLGQGLPRVRGKVASSALTPGNPNPQAASSALP